MLTLQYIRDNYAEVIQKLKIKNFTADNIVKKILDLDREHRSLQKQQEDNQAELNKVSKQIGILFRDNKITEAEEAKKRTAELKESIKKITQDQIQKKEQLLSLLIQLPNVPHSSVPKGKTSNDNLEIRSGGIIPELADNAQPHWDLARKYNLIDFELGNKITASGFPLYKGKGAKLQRALINFFLDENENAGYTECIPPLMVNEASAFSTGQLPDKEGQMYHVQSDNFYLIPTAEVPVTNIYRDVILDPSEFPVKNTAYTPCFRREAGSYGKDVRGLNRVHQFDKVEIVQIQHPERSYHTLNEMVEHVEGLLIKLELPYRIMQLCGGDISFHSALTYDFEVFSAAQKKWLEVSSVSNFESFQANRLKLRFKEKNTKKTVLAHTLNGSALALPRIVAALLENNQTEKNIRIPEVLHKYLGFTEIN